MKLVIMTGMPGAGKSEVADAFRRAGFPVIVMGDVIRKEVMKRGLTQTPENNRKIMLDLREKEGFGAVAKYCLEELRSIDSSIIVIEGCRSLAEVDVFDSCADSVLIVCVHSSPKIRYQRLCQRGRDDDPQDWGTFRERDIREISVGLGGVIALSDIMIVNDGSIGELRKESDAIVKSLV
ncbi:MAG: flagellar hook-basal body complex protein FliE [Candidatus Thorarchaeota archaeon]|nr:flagellar hook-basal body complex protein FliE [Candidatus Thorarchaeota archaeon]